MRKTILILGGLLCGACQESTAPVVCVIRTDSITVWSNGQVVPLQSTAVCQRIKAP